MIRAFPVRMLALCALSLAVQACSSGEETKGGADQKPTKVGFVVIRASNVPDMAELSGRVAAFQLSEVRPQVSGVIQMRQFTEGAIVRQGQTLFQIDSRLYEATAAEARANLASATATAEAARVRAERLRPLAEMEAVSRQDYTDALAQSRQAAASVAQSRAQLNSAQIAVGFTRVPAPITGRIGRALFTEGALVSSNQAQPLAVIQRLDPVYVDIQQSSTDMLALRRSLAGGTATAGDAEVRLLLEDGSEYDLPGRVSFGETIVDPATGTVTLRARFPNPEGLLLPGMFVRARFVRLVNTRAFLVPPSALRREANGKANVLVVGADNLAEQRPVEATRTYNGSWVVTEGLKDGDRIITQGGGRLRPKAPIEPVPADTPQRIAPPKPKG